MVCKDWEEYSNLDLVLQQITQDLLCHNSSSWNGGVPRFKELKRRLNDTKIAITDIKQSPEDLANNTIQVVFILAKNLLKTNWDELPNIQDALDAIHSEIKQYGSSLIWTGSCKTFDTVRFHLQRMYGYEPINTLTVPAGVTTQFTTADEKKLIQAAMETQPADLAQRPGQPPTVSINWDMFNSIAAPAGLICESVEADGHSDVWTGSTKKYQELVAHLQGYDVLPIDFPPCIVDGHTSVVFGKMPKVIITQKIDGVNHAKQGMSIADIRTKSAVLNTKPTDEALRKSISENIVSRTSHVDQSESRCHRSDVKSVHVYYYAIPGNPDQAVLDSLQAKRYVPPVFWHHRGQPSIRLASVESVDYVIDNSFIVLTTGNCYELKFKSHKAATVARRSLIVKLES